MPARSHSTSCQLLSYVLTGHRHGACLLAWTALPWAGARHRKLRCLSRAFLKVRYRAPVRETFSRLLMRAYVSERSRFRRTYMGAPGAVHVPPCCRPVYPFAGMALPSFGVSNCALWGLEAGQAGRGSVRPAPDLVAPPDHPVRASALRSKARNCAPHPPGGHRDLPRPPAGPPGPPPLNYYFRKSSRRARTSRRRCR